MTLTHDAALRLECLRLLFADRYVDLHGADLLKFASELEAFVDRGALPGKDAPNE